jgi:hypothetical protein
MGVSSPMRALIPLALAALLTLAPATAQDAQPACPDGQVETPEGCSQQAWVDDCPPDHLCAAGVEDPGHDAGSRDDGPTAPQDCGGDVCAYDSPGSYGPDGCIDCTQAPPLHTCMDGADPGEDCDDDVQYIGGPGQPAQPAQESGDGAGRLFTPALSVALLLGLLAAFAAVARRK